MIIIVVFLLLVFGLLTGFVIVPFAKADEMPHVPVATDHAPTQHPAHA